ncbi:MAG: NAD(P)H-dependent glycerol-3-phosphate dehydrogenase [Oscillospiraceae bacterium]
MANIFIYGAGSFGAALAILFSKSGHSVALCARNPEQVNEMKETHISRLLPKVQIPENVFITSSFDKLKDADIFIIATPSHAVREVCIKVKDMLTSRTVVTCVSKGFEEHTLKRMSEVMGEELPNSNNVILSGPTHAEEIANSIPTALVAASYSRESAEYIQDTLSTSCFRIYVNDDVVGVELGGALKNVIALAAGALDGRGLGDNTKAALMTRGITEIARLGIACGAKTETFTGLSGIGDLIVTCTSMHSRNHRAGLLIGQGNTVSQAIALIGMTVEGYKNSKSAYELSQKYDVEMPIITQVYKILYENKPMGKAIEDLMERPKRHESEAVWLLNK